MTVLNFELQGRIRLLRELGRHWSILTGEECFKVFDDNLLVLSQTVRQVPLNGRETAKRIRCYNSLFIKYMIYFRFRQYPMR